MSVKSGMLEQAIATSLDYILAHQSTNGSWTEWDLQPGISSGWTTAYIGYKLRNLPKHLKKVAAPHIYAGSRWLLDNAFTDGGWGYNKYVGSDADSTSFAILFLTSAGQHVPERAYTHLARFQRANGGFSTFLPGQESGAWSVAHPDVTAVAMLALACQAVPKKRALRSGIEYVLEQKNEDGLWNSFWWDSCLYGTEVNMAFLRREHIAVDLPTKLFSYQPANVFEIALLISIMLHAQSAALDAKIDDLINQLINQQQRDGSWNSVPILRITSRDCFEPWLSDDPGTLHADPQRLFTTATALCALSTAII